MRLDFFFLTVTAFVLGTPETFSQTVVSSPAPTTTTTGTSANSSSSGAQTTDIAMGGTSMAMGGAMMETSCGHPGGTMLCAVGAASAAAGVTNIATGMGQSGTISGTAALGGTDGIGGSSGTLDTGSSGFSTTGLPQPVADAFNNAQQIAQQNGMDLTNPASIDAYKQANGVGGDGGGPNGGSLTLPPDVQAAVQKAKDDFLAQFHVSSVALEGGSGGVQHHSKAADDFDMKAFLDSVNGNPADGSRGPASIAGLQKNLGGDAIGVAGDNIFSQVSRRYQAKIASKTFLPPPLK